ncbi:MAG: phosphatidylcholine/phosphatidylserine synthase [Sandaracinaceae bacterium]
MSSSNDVEPAAAPKKRFSMIRSFALADFITLANGASGTGSILLCLAYVESHDPRAIWAAFALLPLALACDALDGMVARWRRRSSPYGADLDSLADVVSFGVAPAVLGYTLGLRGGWDALIFLYFVACGISRLARFNATAASLADESGKVSHYEGTPIPTSLALALVLAILHWQSLTGDTMALGRFDLGPWELHPITLLYAVSGSLMISTFKIPKP